MGASFLPLLRGLLVVRLSKNPSNYYKKMILSRELDKNKRQLFVSCLFGLYLPRFYLLMPSGFFFLFKKTKVAKPINPIPPAGNNTHHSQFKEELPEVETVLLSLPKLDPPALVLTELTASFSLLFNTSPESLTANAGSSPILDTGSSPADDAGVPPSYTGVSGVAPSGSSSPGSSTGTGGTDVLFAKVISIGERVIPFTTAAIVETP